MPHSDWMSEVQQSYDGCLLLPEPIKVEPEDDPGSFKLSLSWVLSRGTEQAVQRTVSFEVKA